MLHDNTWSPNDDKVGVASLAFGNRLQIETEYQLNTSEDGSFMVDNLSPDNQSICLESYDYVTKHDTGTFVTESPENYIYFSNEYAWVCDANQGHLEGKAISYPRKRWKPTDPNILWPSMLSKDIVFYSNAIDDNKLYLTVALKYDITNGAQVADISLKLYNPPDPSLYSEYSPIASADYVNITLTPEGSLYSTSIVAQPYPPWTPGKTTFLNTLWTCPP